MHSRFTLMSEAFAIEVILARENVKAVSGLLNLDRNTADAIMKRVVDRVLVSRHDEGSARMDFEWFSAGRYAAAWGRSSIWRNT